jgi:hypothetical protein
LQLKKILKKYNMEKNIKDLGLVRLAEIKAAKLADMSLAVDTFARENGPIIAAGGLDVRDYMGTALSKVAGEGKSFSEREIFAAKATLQHISGHGAIIQEQVKTPVNYEKIVNNTEELGQNRVRFEKAMANNENKIKSLDESFLSNLKNAEKLRGAIETSQAQKVNVSVGQQKQEQITR